MIQPKPEHLTSRREGIALANERVRLTRKKRILNAPANEHTDPIG